MNHDVFISYSSRDAQVASQVFHALQKRGCHCWMAPQSVRPGQRWAATIDQAISQCNVFMQITHDAQTQTKKLYEESLRAIGKKRVILILEEGTQSSESEIEGEAQSSESEIVVFIPQNASLVQWDEKIAYLHQVIAEPSNNLVELDSEDNGKHSTIARLLQYLFIKRIAISLAVTSILVFLSGWYGLHLQYRAGQAFWRDWQSVTSSFGLFVWPFVKAANLYLAVARVLAPVWTVVTAFVVSRKHRQVWGWFWLVLATIWACHSFQQYALFESRNLEDWLTQSLSLGFAFIAALSLTSNYRAVFGRWWRQWGWFLLLLSASIALLLGYYGYLIYPHKPAQTGFDSLLYSLQLFVLNSQGDPSGHGLNWPLQSARILAPLIAFSAVINAFLGICQRLWLWTLHDHVVICGLGQKGLTIGKQCLSQGYKVVAIDSDPQNSLSEEFKDLGGMVIQGSAVDEAILKMARIQRARDVYCVCGSDAANVETSHQCERICRRDGSKKDAAYYIQHLLGYITFSSLFDPSLPLICTVHVRNPRLRDHLEERLFDESALQLTDDQYDRFCLYPNWPSSPDIPDQLMKSSWNIGRNFRKGYFSTAQQGAKKLLALTSSADETDPAKPMKEAAFIFPQADWNRNGEQYPREICIVGLGAMGESLLTEIARRCSNPSKGDYQPRVNPPTRVIVADPEAKMKMKALISLREEIASSYCNPDETSDKTHKIQLIAWEVAFDDAALLQGQQLDSCCQQFIIFLCLEDSIQATSIALDLRQLLPGRCDIVLMLNESEGLPTLIGQDSTTGYEDLFAFPVIEATCHPDDIRGGLHEEIARTIHQYYQDSIRKDQKQKLAYTQEWKELEEIIRESNRLQADCYCQVLGWMGYRVQRAKSGRSLRDDPQYNELIQAMATLDHERYRRERLKQGWCYRPVAEGKSQGKRWEGLRRIRWNSTLVPCMQEFSDAKDEKGNSTLLKDILGGKFSDRNQTTAQRVLELLEENGLYFARTR